MSRGRKEKNNLLGEKFARTQNSTPNDSVVPTASSPTPVVESASSPGDHMMFRQYNAIDGNHFAVGSPGPAFVEDDMNVDSACASPEPKANNLLRHLPDSWSPTGGKQTQNNNMDHQQLVSNTMAKLVNGGTAPASSSSLKRKPDLAVSPSSHLHFPSTIFNT